MDSKIFGIALVTADGKVYTAGDIKSEVSIQSISKVFTHGQGDRGAGARGDREDDWRGRDRACASTRSSSIELSQKVLGGPEMNSLVNPGAITTTSMVKGSTRDEVWKSILGYYSRLRRPAALGEPGGLQVGGRRPTSATRRSAMLMYAYGYIKDESDAGHRPLHRAVLGQRQRARTSRSWPPRSPTAARTR